MKKGNDRSTRFHELRQRVNAIGKIKDGDIAMMSPDEIRQLVHTLHTYQIELGLQNEELHIAEEIVLKSQKKYSDLYDFAPIGYLTIGEKGTIVESNLTFATMVDVERNRLIDQTLSSFIVEEDQDIYYLFRRESFETRIRQTCELRIKRKDDRFFWACLESSITDRTETGVTYLRLTVSNITERKQSEEALRESERLLNTTGRMARIGGWEHDLTTGKAVWTEALYDIIEVEPGTEPPGVHEHLNYYPPEHRKTLEEAYRRSIEEGTPFDLELQGHTAKGKLLWCRAYGEPVIHQGRCIKMRGTFQDITDRKRAEEALLRREAEFRATFYSIGDAIISTDTDGRVTRMNPEAERLTGWTEMDAGGQPLDAVFNAINEETRDPMENPPKCVLLDENSAGSADNLLLVTRDGREFPIAYSVTPIRGNNNRLEGVALVFRDRTVERKALSILEESEWRYYELFDNMSDGVVIYEVVNKGADFIIKDMNNAGLRIVKQKKENTIGQKVQDIFPGIKDIGLFDVLRHVWRTGIPQRLPLSHYTDKRLTVWIDNLVYKLPSGEIVAIYQDVTKQKQAEDALRLQTDFLASLLHAIPIPLFYKDTECRYLGCNPAFEKITGKKLPNLIGKTVFEVWKEKYGCIHNDADMQLLNKPGIQQYETQFESADGQMLDVIFNKSTFYNQKGKVAGIIGVLVDITERKRAEEALKENQRMLSTLMGNLPGMAYRCYYDRQWTTEYVSEGIFELTGYNPSDFLVEGNSNYSDLIHPCDREYVWETVQDSIKKDEPFELEYRIVTREGYEKWVWERGLEVSKSEISRRTILEGFVCDITQRKKAEEALRESEARLKEAEKVAHLGHWKLDLQTEKILWSDEVYRIFEVDPSQFEATNDAFLGLVHPDDRELVNSSYQKSVKNKTSYSVDHRILMKDGRIKYVHEECVTVYDGQHPVYSLGTVQDITERKRAEETLRVSEERFKRALENIPDVVVIYDRNLRIQYINSATRRITGRLESDFIGKRDDEIWPPEIYQTFLPTLQEALNTRSIRSIETDLLLPERGFLNLQITCVPLIDESGDVREILGITHDITGQKRAEKAIRDNQKRLIEAQHIAQMGDFTWNLETGEVTWSDALYDLLGYAKSEPIDYAKVNADIHHPGDRQRIVKWLHDCISSDSTELAPNEYRILRKDGEAICVRTVGVIERREGKAVRIFATIQDITERKQAENALSESMNKYYSLFNDALDMIHIVDKDGTIVDANRSELNKLGYSKDELIGKKLSEIVHPDYKEISTQNLKKAIEGYDIRVYQTVYVTKAGSKIEIEVNAVPQIHHGKVINVRAIVRDVTERNKLITEIHKSQDRLHALTERLITLREEEQTRIARDLHDRLGHAITGLKMDLNWLNNKLPAACKKTEFPPIKNKIDSMMIIADETVKSVRQICSELRPGMLDNLGLIPTIEWEMQEFSARTGLKYILDTPPSVPVDPNRGTILYRIVQEALTNIIRHAQASEVRIHIEQNEDTLLLEIIDNGRGIGESEIVDSHSLGLLGIQERSMILGGKATIEGTPDQGTTVRVVIPINNE